MRPESTPSATGPVLPARFGRYTLLERVGGGGMATVYRASLSAVGGFEKEVAVKVVRVELAEDPQFTQMFLDEARLSARLNHANIVQTFDFGHEEGVHFLAMELVRGRTLAALLKICRAKGRRLGLGPSLRIASEVAKALDYAHRLVDIDGRSLGIVHRDVSPQNVLVSREGEVKLADFGIAKAVMRSHVTQPGRVRGKCAYMAPEQIRGQELDGRADVFALGVVLWESLTGRTLFDGSSDGAVLHQVLEKEILPPSWFAPEVPKEVDELVARLLSRDVEERPDGRQAARELADSIWRRVRSEADIDLAEVQRSLGSGTAVLDPSAALAASSRRNEGEAAPVAPVPAGTTARELSEIDLQWEDPATIGERPELVGARIAEPGPWASPRAETVIPERPPAPAPPVTTAPIAPIEAPPDARSRKGVGARRLPLSVALVAVIVAGGAVGVGIGLQARAPVATGIEAGPSVPTADDAASFAAEGPDRVGSPLAAADGMDGQDEALETEAAPADEDESPAGGTAPAEPAGQQTPVSPDGPVGAGLDAAKGEEPSRPAEGAQPLQAPAPPKRPSGAPARKAPTRTSIAVDPPGRQAAPAKPTAPPGKLALSSRLDGETLVQIDGARTHTLWRNVPVMVQVEPGNRRITFTHPESGLSCTVTRRFESEKQVSLNADSTGVGLLEGALRTPLACAPAH